jgi:pseudouridine-5'-phosphate glycosidase
MHPLNGYRVAHHPSVLRCKLAVMSVIRLRDCPVSNKSAVKARCQYRQSITFHTCTTALPLFTSAVSPRGCEFGVGILSTLLMLVHACRLATIARHLPCMNSGMVVGVPVPEEEEAFGARVQKAIDQAVAEVGQKGSGGASVTPYVLERVRSLTGGESLQANIRLVLNNARVGADIAVAIAAQRLDRSKL